MPLSPGDALDVIEENKPGSGSQTIGQNISGPHGNHAADMQNPKNPHSEAGPGVDPHVDIEGLLKDLGLDPNQIHDILSGGSGGSSGGTSGSSFNPMQAALEDTYFRLWGKRAPPGVIDGALSAGLNIFQFEDQIRQDPAFRKTETYQNEYADNVLQLAQLLGVIPG